MYVCMWYACMGIRGSREYMCMYTYIECMYVCMYVCTYVRMYVKSHIHTYTYTHIHAYIHTQYGLGSQETGQGKEI